MSGQTLQKGLVPLPGGGVAVYNGSGLLYYGHSDHLGSIRLGSTPSRTVYFDIAYAPFGETYVPSGATDPSFTGQRQDTVAGLYDFPDRQYSTQGRWPTPDPAGLASMHTSDPQTLNRYAYVRNNPLVMIDPQGLDECFLNPQADPMAAGGIDCEDLGSGDENGGDSPADPNSGGDASNSGSNCAANATACGGNTDCSSGAACDPSSQGPSQPGPNDPNQKPDWCPSGDACDPTSNPPDFSLFFMTGPFSGTPPPDSQEASRIPGGVFAGTDRSGCDLMKGLSYVAGVGGLAFRSPYLAFIGLMADFTHDATCPQ
jgi:RHS repeat-associated protein